MRPRARWRSISMNKAMDASGPVDHDRVDHFFSMPGARADRWRALHAAAQAWAKGTRIEGEGRGGVRRAWRLRGLLRLSRPQPDRGAGSTDRVRRGRGRRVACPAHLRSDPDPVLQARHGRLGNGRGHGRGAARAQHGHDGPRRARAALFRDARRLATGAGPRARTRSRSCASSAAPRTPSSTKRCPSAASRTRSARPS